MFDTSMYHVQPKADPKNVICGKNYRFTVITSRMIRMEYEPDGRFEDGATKLAFCRDFGEVPFELRETEEHLEIVTEHLHLFYDKAPFSQGNPCIRVKNMREHKTWGWSYGMPELRWQARPGISGRDNLGGTAKTLDGADGAAQLCDGLLSKTGIAVIDDSETMVLTKTGWFDPLYREGRIDLYFFGYQKDFRECIRDFVRLCGGIPMVPRYALGTWWSRYHKYTEKTYRELMQKFEEEKLPLSVAVLDTNWHLWDEEIPEGAGVGWTGYTWNKTFFPDPEKFLAWLHQRGLHVTLNLHPHDGVRYFEEGYERLAKALDFDTSKKEPIPFAPHDEKKFTAYLENILHPIEDQGVDFWWLDYQQRDVYPNRTDVMRNLNHALFTDNVRKQKRPMLLSRFVEHGSCRYPVGFSGDTMMTWESLDYQPYFTATASNIGFGWWSHDIGGHTCGEWSYELQTRWIQYGVFSPIFRPHSGNSPVLNKEPWTFPLQEREIARSFYQLRHRLIPYLFTADYHCHKDGRMLIEPIFYEFKSMLKSREFDNEYLFGGQMLVCPITEKINKSTRMGKIHTWLPEGVWFDFFSHRAYRGGRRIDLYRTIDAIPVLVPAGAIIPLDGAAVPENGAPLPKELEIRVFCGADGKYALYEDDGDADAAETPMSFTWGKDAAFTLEHPTAGFLPKERTYRVRFIGCAMPRNLKISGAKKVGSTKRIENGFELKLLPEGGKITVSFHTDGKLRTQDGLQWAIHRLSVMDCDNTEKQRTLQALNTEGQPLAARIAHMQTILTDRDVEGAVLEALTAYWE